MVRSRFEPSISKIHVWIDIPWPTLLVLFMKSVSKPALGHESDISITLAAVS
jgi:hypothetical protein